MAFKKILSVLLSVFLLAAPLLFADSQLDDPRADLNEKNDAELIALSREIRDRSVKDPSNAELYYELSMVYTVLFDRTRKKSAQSNEWLEKSAEALERAVMIRPTHKVALYNLGVVYKRQGHMERAREELRKALRACDPSADSFLMTAIWMQMGSVYEEQGFFDEAKEAYEKAQDLDPGNENIRNVLLELKQKRAEAGENSSSYNVSAGGMMGSAGPVARSYDPMSGADTQPQGLARVMPALGSLLSKKASGSQSGQDDSGQS
jgi:tetratricopeptide (TPR) repeat protein